MTNSIDANTPSPAQKEPILANSPKTPRTKIMTLIIIAIGCLIFAIAINLQLRVGTQQKINTLLDQINNLKQQQLNTDKQVATSLKLISDNQEKFHEEISTLDKYLQTALKQRLYQTKDWLLLKARYCIELAQINAHWSDNSETTIALLQQADTLLVDVHEQRAFPIRQAISKEITALQTMPKLDIAGLLSQLDAAQNVIATLELKPAISPEEKLSTNESNHTSSTWRKHLKNTVGLLEKLVVVRRHDEDILPLPSPAYESMLREGIRLNLQEAQWALLQNNESIYQFSLGQALKNIGRAFAPNIAGTDALIGKLKSLQQIHLIQQKPILELSLPLLNQLIDSKTTPTPNIAGENS